MKKGASLVLAIILAFSCFASYAFADDVDVVELDDGYYVVYTLRQNESIQTNSVNTTRVISGNRTANLYNSSDELVATVTINGTFQYDGTSAEATKATYNYHVYGDGWRFDSGRAYCDGNQAIANVTFTKTLARDQVVIVTLTCSPTGQLS